MNKITGRLTLGPYDYHGISAGIQFAISRFKLTNSTAN